MKYDTRLRSSPGLLVHFEAVKEQGRGGYGDCREEGGVFCDLLKRDSL